MERSTRDQKREGERSACSWVRMACVCIDSCMRLVYMIMYVSDNLMYATHQKLGGFLEIRSAAPLGVQRDLHGSGRLAGEGSGRKQH